MPNKNLLLDAMLAGGIVTFDPDGAKTAPYTAEVESLLGGVPVVTHPDGTEQFLDNSAEPVMEYSPRLPAGELEEFCKKNIGQYTSFHAEHGDELLMSDRILMMQFW